MRLACLMTKNADILPLLELRRWSRTNGKGFDILHLEEELLHCSRAIFVARLIEAAHFRMNNPTKFKAFHAPVVYRSGEQLVKDLYDVFNESLKPYIFWLVHECEFGCSPKQRRVDQKVVLNTMTLFKYDLKNRVSWSAEKNAVQESRLVSSVRK